MKNYDNIPSFSYAQNEAQFMKRISGAISAYFDKGITTETGFLDEHEIFLAKSVFEDEWFNSYYFSGGYNDATRKCLIIGDDIPFNISVIESVPDKFHCPNHRDYLGSLMGLGIDRKVIGDIICLESGKAYITVFDKNSMSEYIVSNLKKVGTATVKLSRCGIEVLDNIELTYENFEIFIPSFRIDAIVAAVSNTSRSVSQEVIESKCVKLNGFEIGSNSVEAKIGDVFSIKGIGKFKIIKSIGITKHGKIKLELNKYSNFTERK